MEPRLVKIGEAARLLGTTPDTLRKWESTGELLPHRKTKGGTRYYSMETLLGLRTDDVPTIGYARVSSHDQRLPLDRRLLTNLNEPNSLLLCDRYQAEKRPRF